MPGQPLVERPLLSPGAAWIVRRILAGEAKPLADSLLPGVVPLAVKTGTSYGYRDAWAIGVNPRYLIGVWVGRPDGTPVAGQFGFASAVPVLNQINNLLMTSPGFRGNWLPVDPRPATVTAGSLCWPGGQALPEGDGNCRQRKQSWILEGTTPPTLLAEGQENLAGLQQPVWINAAGLRVAADCPQAKGENVVLWPLPLEPWLPVSERRQQRLPAVDPRCPPLDNGSAVPLILTGVRSGQLLHRLPGKSQLDVNVTSQGGRGNQRWWFLDGRALTRPNRQDTVNLSLGKAGSYQLTVLDEGGQVASATFTVE